MTPTKYEHPLEIKAMHWGSLETKTTYELYSTNETYWGNNGTRANNKKVDGRKQIHGIGKDTDTRGKDTQTQRKDTREKLADQQ